MDFALACYCNRLGSGWIDGLTETFCAIWFLGLFWAAMLGLVWWRDRARARAVTLGVTLAMIIDAVVTEVVLKRALTYVVPMRVRPWMAHPEAIVPIGYRFEDSSFPSGHAASTAAILTVIVRYYPRALVPAIAFTLAQAFSRVHCGMHYPTDVLSGTILGVGYGLVALVLARRIAPGVHAGVA